MLTQFTTKLLSWYAVQARVLPWRVNSPDPYIVWISEIMLQQTRVETVVPYFERWMVQFPTLQSLAAASQQEVLRAWEGLGYYSRARNIHRTAQIIIEQYHGEFPGEIKTLRSLPGIGPYTAGAIASIAFHTDEPALDGNVHRVFARCFNVAYPLGSPQAEQVFRDLAHVHLPANQAGKYNQALMDLGATICTPRSPDCNHCPLIESCEAYRINIVEERPLRSPKLEMPHRVVSAAVIWLLDQVLIIQRPEKGLLGGLWEFPQSTIQQSAQLLPDLQPESLKQDIARSLGIDISVKALLDIYHHAFTHFKLTVRAVECTLVNGADLRTGDHTHIAWVKIDDLVKYPMGKIDRLISNRISMNHKAGL